MRVVFRKGIREKEEEGRQKEEREEEEPRQVLRLGRAE